MTVVHGALDHAELAALRLEPHTLLDFSSNVNPYGPPRRVAEAVAALDYGAYPDRSCFRLRQAIAELHGVDPDHVLVGNGSNELIHLLARALLQPGDSALVIGPTFGEYARASELAGANVLLWCGCRDHGFQIDHVLIVERIQRQRPRLVWLCSPNNPTGIAISAEGLVALAGACREMGSRLIVDRAYADMLRDAVPDAVDTAELHSFVIQLHSLTKLYALAGLRLGYLVAHHEVIERVAAYQPTWSVNSAAQAAGLAALGDKEFVRVTLPRLWQSSDQLRRELRALGLTVLPSRLPFMLVHTGNGAATRKDLLQQGCVVRDCASFGLPEYVRVAPRKPEENLILVNTWRRLWPHQS